MKKVTATPKTTECPACTKKLTKDELLSYKRDRVLCTSHREKRNALLAAEEGKADKAEKITIAKVRPANSNTLKGKVAKATAKHAKKSAAQPLVKKSAKAKAAKNPERVEAARKAWITIRAKRDAAKA